MEQELPEALNSLEADLSKFAHKKEEQRAFSHSSTSSSSQSSALTLQDSIDELLLMFKRANEELTLEQREEKLIRSQLDPIFKKLTELGEQQETMASAIVSISDAIEGLTSSVNEIKARISASELSSMMPRSTPQIQPQFSKPSRPSYQQFEFNNAQMQSGQDQQEALPPPPPLNQSIPNIKPNELGQKRSLF